MEKKYRSRQLKKRERQYFAAMFGTYVCLTLAVLLIADRIFLLFETGPYIRLAAGLALMALTAVLTGWIARGNMLRLFIRQFRVEK